MAKEESKDDSKPAAASAKSEPPTSAAPPSAVEAIEEDDEFEEFDMACQWNANDEDAEDSQQWQVRSIDAGVTSPFDMMQECSTFSFYYVPYRPSLI